MIPLVGGRGRIRLSDRTGCGIEHEHFVSVEGDADQAGHAEDRGVVRERSSGPGRTRGVGGRRQPLDPERSPLATSTAATAPVPVETYTRPSAASGLMVLVIVLRRIMPAEEIKRVEHITLDEVDRDQHFAGQLLGTHPIGRGRTRSLRG